MYTIFGGIQKGSEAYASVHALLLWVHQIVVLADITCLVNMFSSNLQIFTKLTQYRANLFLLM